MISSREQYDKRFIEQINLLEDYNKEVEMFESFEENMIVNLAE